jgi:hypothetical protein
MTIDDLWVRYQKYVSEINEICRKFAFSGIAIAWATKPNDESLPLILKFTRSLIVTFLILDLSHQALGAYLKKIQAEGEERSHAHEYPNGHTPGDRVVFTSSNQDRWPALMFLCKVVVMAISLILLFVCLITA